MLSSKSLLCIWKSRCLNSHALKLALSVAIDILRLRTDLLRFPRCCALYESRTYTMSSISRGLYLFNCRTKLAKLECLKCCGNTFFVNSLF